VEGESHGVSGVYRFGRRRCNRFIWAKQSFLKK